MNRQKDSQYKEPELSKKDAPLVLLDELVAVPHVWWFMHEVFLVVAAPLRGSFTLPARLRDGFVTLLRVILWLGHSWVFIAATRNVGIGRRHL